MRHFFLFLFWINCFPVLSTHIVGGEVYYDCLGGNNYKVTVKVYRDCGPANINETPFDENLPLTIYNASNTLVGVFEIPLEPALSIPTISTNPCLTPPPQCIEVATYETIVNLPPSPGGYTLVYQRCCRNSSIQNLLNPSSSGGTYFVKIPDPGLATCNSSPRFSNLPPLVICVDDLFAFNHAATDPDGDSLVYSFYTPFEGGTPSSPAPNPCDPPPYVPLAWATGYSQNNQILGSPSLTIDPVTGFLTCNPSILGIYVYAVKVSEYRDGQLLSEALREFQINVVTCTVNVSSLIEPQSAIQLCGGLTLDFTNNSLFASFFHWDFGVDGVLTDTSNLLNPTYTFPDTGSYNVTLIANPGTFCADTIVETFQVHLPLSISYPEQAAQCITTNSFDITGVGNFTSSANVNWFLPGANVTTMNGNPANNISYADSGRYLATLEVTEFGCTETYTDTLVVFPLPVIAFSYPDLLACEPYTVTFTDSSLSWSPIEYYWTFGDGTSSNEQNPTHTYLDTGIYSVSLTIAVDSICVFEQTLMLDSIIHVYPSPDALLAVTPKLQSVLTPTIEVTNLAQGYSSQIIYFGDGDSTLLTYAQHNYLDTGWFQLNQWTINQYGCIDVDYDSVYIIPEPSVFIPNAFSPNNDGLNEVFLPVVRDVREYELTIFNRWGNVLFNTTDPLQGWDGKCNNKLMETEVYVYLVRYMDQGYIWQEKKGHFTLLK